MFLVTQWVVSENVIKAVEQTEWTKTTIFVDLRRRPGWSFYVGFFTTNPSQKIQPCCHLRSYWLSTEQERHKFFPMSFSHVKCNLTSHVWIKGSVPLYGMFDIAVMTVKNKTMDNFPNHDPNEKQCRVVFFCLLFGSFIRIIFMLSARRGLSGWFQNK